MRNAKTMLMRMKKRYGRRRETQRELSIGRMRFAASSVYKVMLQAWRREFRPPPLLTIPICCAMQHCSSR